MQATTRVVVLVAMLAAILPTATAAYPTDRYLFETATSVQAEPVLLAKYAFDIDPTLYDKIKYFPRQLANGFVVPDPSWQGFTVNDAGAYAGWDVHTTLNYGGMRFNDNPTWFNFTLTRDATVAVVWRGSTASTPTWLTGGGWTKSGTITARSTVIGTRVYPVYKKVLTAGDQSLPGVGYAGQTIGNDTYWVLFAEANGQPTAPPPVPNGQEAIPQPNQACPAWVHDLWMTTGPDGQLYRTWHPQIDPVYWCYYGHEHGTDPDYCAPNWEPPFDFVAQKHGMSEPHAGFKVYVVTGEDNPGVRGCVVQHFGTGSIARACARFHSFELVFFRERDNTLLADVQFMADYGMSLHGDSIPPVALTPPNCPTQSSVQSQTHGQRQIVSNTGNTGYEPWRCDEAGNILGIVGCPTINTRDPIVVCGNIPACSVPFVFPDRGGASRFVGTTHFSLDPNKAKATGQFCTNPAATALLDCAAAGAVPQYIAPGAVVGWPCIDHAADRDAWGQPYVCHLVGIDSEREDSITSGGPN